MAEDGEPRELDPNWRERERIRFADGTYKRVPWEREGWSARCAEHFVHVSRQDPSQVSYIDNPEHGQRHRYTRMKPGRYLKKFYGDLLDARSCAVWAERFAAMNEPIGVNFAMTQEQIEQVYLGGPGSCMTHDKSKFNLPIHPTCVFAAGDLAVAYIRETRSYAITARALVWPERKVYGRLYGDTSRLEAGLERLGYAPGSMEGARLLRIKAPDGLFIAPYLDNHHSSPFTVEDQPPYLIITRNGKLVAHGTSGRAQPHLLCARCAVVLPVPSNGYAVFTGVETVRWCRACIVGASFQCRHCLRYLPKALEAARSGGERWCTLCAADRTHCEAGCGRVTPRTEPRCAACSLQAPVRIPYSAAARLRVNLGWRSQEMAAAVGVSWDAWRNFEENGDPAYVVGNLHRGICNTLMRLGLTYPEAVRDMSAIPLPPIEPGARIRMIGRERVGLVTRMIPGYSVISIAWEGGETQLMPETTLSWKFFEIVTPPPLRAGERRLRLRDGAIVALDTREPQNFLFRTRDGNIQAYVRSQSRNSSWDNVVMLVPIPVEPSGQSTPNEE